MTIFQFLASSFAFFMIYVVSIHSKKRNLSAAETSFWVTTWTVFVIMALFPNLLLGVVHVLRFGRVFDLLVVIAFMVLSSMAFSNYFSHKELSAKLERYVRTQAFAELAAKTSTTKRKTRRKSATKVATQKRVTRKRR